MHQLDSLLAVTGKCTYSPSKAQSKVITEASKDNIEDYLVSSYLEFRTMALGLPFHLIIRNSGLSLSSLRGLPRGPSSETNQSSMRRATSVAAQRHDAESGNMKPEVRHYRVK